MAKITYENKVGVKPKTVRINQVWDDDMNQIKEVVNTNDDNTLYQGDNTLKKTTTVQVTPDFAININDGKVTSFVIADETIQLNGTIKIIPNGITPIVGNALGYTDTDGSIGQIPISNSKPIDNQLSNTSTNALENKTIEDTFQKTIQTATEEQQYRLPRQCLTYVRLSALSNDLTNFTPTGQITIFKQTSNTDWYVLIDDDMLDNTVSGAMFEKTNAIIYIHATDQQPVPETTILHEQRLVNLYVSTNDVINDFVGIPLGYSVYKEHRYNFSRSTVAGSNFPVLQCFNFSLVV